MRFRAIGHYLSIAILVALSLFLCLGFWFTTSDWNRTVLGRFSLAWFVGALVANLLILALTFLCIRALRVNANPDRSKIVPYSQPRKLAFKCVVVAMLLLSAEVALRFIEPPHKRAFTTATGSAQFYHSALQLTERVERDGRLRRAYGERIYPRQKHSRFRIVCLGGSTTEGHELRPEDAWPAMLEQKLQEVGYDCEIINAGKAWYSTAQLLISYCLDVRFFDPDLVIVQSAINDVGRSFSRPGEPPFERDYGSSHGPMRLVLQDYSSEGLANEERSWNPLWSSALVRRVCKVTAIDRMFYRSLRGETPPPVRPPTVDVGLEGFPSIQSHRENLAYLVRLCEADGRRVVLATQPHLYNCPQCADRPGVLNEANNTLISRDSMAAAMNACRQTVLDVASGTSAVVADTERAVAAKSEYFVDDVHLLAEGNALVAATFLPVVSQVLDELNRSAEAQAATVAAADR